MHVSLDAVAGPLSRPARCRGGRCRRSLRVGAQVYLADAVQQFGEAEVPIGIWAQHQPAGARLGEVVQRLVPPGDRSADRDAIAGAARVNGMRRVGRRAVT